MPERRGAELAFDRVSTSFGSQQVLEGVSLAADASESLAIIGPSGAGKTTLLRLANGAIRPDSGSVTVDGDRASDRRVALAYHGETLIDRRTALANVLSGRVGELSWWQGLLEPLAPRNPEPALALLDALGVADVATRRADALSAGERQRVALARALVREVPVVLADEPTASLDPASRSEVLSVIADVAGDRTLVVVLHDVDLALDRFDRVVGLADGRVRFDVPAADVSEPMIRALYDGDPSTAESPTPGRRGANERDDAGQPRPEAMWRG